MARDELFSFGDEDLGGSEPSWDSEEGSGQVALLESPSPGDNGGETAAEGAWPSRGGSRQRSSEKRQPPPLRFVLAAAVALLVGLTVLARPLVGGGSEETARVAQSAADRSTAADGPIVVGGEGAGFIEASKQKASQAQRARQRRAATRHRSQRRRAHRDKHGGGRGADRPDPRRARSSASDSSSGERAAAPAEPDPAPAPPPPPVEPPPAPAVEEAGGTTASVPDDPPASPTEAAQGQFGVESAGGPGSGIGG